MISGFKVNDEVDRHLPERPPRSRRRSPSIDETVLWFEALFDAKSNSLASTNVTLLTTGQMSARGVHDRPAGQHRRQRLIDRMPDRPGAFTAVGRAGVLPTLRKGWMT